MNRKSALRQVLLSPVVCYVIGVVIFMLPPHPMTLLKALYAPLFSLYFAGFLAWQKVATVGLLIAHHRTHQLLQVLPHILPLPLLLVFVLLALLVAVRRGTRPWIFVTQAAIAILFGVAYWFTKTEFIPGAIY